ncbi:histidine phosphatase family protein [Pseudodesulfovibrio sp. S3]|uniref:histidine phosphatase family protein n=1 Tax=unclassified Pseudodesulfovibrio TaxID=2661612 RepID=UPI000FEBD484|nr:histidine phosphatase family protein [Pseudodesulfovibrio sp. S3]MCJ2164778.1 histidine phosphatase family protein [Pseudodesulfovibrio sp. S3-i]RWU04038.1 histidine phosphatase family protein [Pseudodesulfovibrio sp. S3]
MIVLLRHARTSGGRGRCIGRTPLPLSGEGVAQALMLEKTLRAVRFARLCSSPSQRALDTIAPLAESLHLSVEVMPGLDEIDMGAWEGFSFEDIRKRSPEEYALRGSRFGSFRPTGGESFNDVADRAMGILDGLAAGPQPVLAVTHAGVIRSVLCRLTGHPLDDLFHFAPDNLGCTVLRPMQPGHELAATGLLPEDIPSFLQS